MKRRRSVLEVVDKFPNGKIFKIAENAKSCRHVTFLLNLLMNDYFKIPFLIETRVNMLKEISKNIIPLVSVFRFCPVVMVPVRAKSSYNLKTYLYISIESLRFIKE